MIPYLGPEFVRALLGLDACDGNAETPHDLDRSKPGVINATKNTFSGPEGLGPDDNGCRFLGSTSFLMTPADSTSRETLRTPLRGRSVARSLWNRLVHLLGKQTGARER